MSQLIATRKPDNAYYSLTLADPCRELVRAVIRRAYWDSVGRVGYCNHKGLKQQHEIMQDARAFFKDGRCCHWLEHLGINPADMSALGLDL